MGYGRARQRCLLGRTRTGPSGQTQGGTDLCLKRPGGDDQLNRYSSPSILPLNHCPPIMSASLSFLKYSCPLPSKSSVPAVPLPGGISCQHPQSSCPLSSALCSNVIFFCSNVILSTSLSILIIWCHHLLSCSIFLTELNTPKCG